MQEILAQKQTLLIEDRFAAYKNPDAVFQKIPRASSAGMYQESKHNKPWLEAVFVPDVKSHGTVATENCILPTP
jgi:hypothetical protein